MGNCRGEERSFRLHAHQEWGRLHWRNDAGGTSESECTSALVSLLPGFRLQGKRGEGEAVGRHPLHGADVHGECWYYVGGRRFITPPLPPPPPPPPPPTPPPPP